MRKAALAASMLFALGGTVKAVSPGKIEGYLVRFGSPDATDLLGDYFTKDTDFGRPFVKDVPQPCNLYWGHGFDETLGATVIGTGSIKMTDAGLWYEAQLEASDDYQEYVAQVQKLADEEKLGLSSGACAHLVQRVPVAGKNIAWIKCWPLGEASATPSPAEPQNVIYTAKAVKGLLSRDWSDPADCADPFAGIGQNLIREGLEQLFYRLVSCLWDACSCETAAEATANLTAALERFEELAASYVTAVITTLTEDEAAAEMDGMKALADSIKTLGTPPSSVREFERRLRDAVGFSRADAAAIASTGWKAFQRDSDPLHGKPVVHADAAKALAEAALLDSEELALLTPAE